MGEFVVFADNSHDEGIGKEQTIEYGGKHHLTLSQSNTHAQQLTERIKRGNTIYFSIIKKLLQK